ncbi:sensor domain-containing diguanylate cyclase [Vibrio scophthalmi]|nr:sensor domain-containing diguanylate cyclase [Vibrio scophthalmi]MCY9804159.1 sensor domain-containing diguanylate cyclase [Vibrio scophthalmi]
MNRIIKAIFIIFIFILTEFLVVEFSKINNGKESSRVISAVNKEMKAIFSDALITSEVLKEMVVLSEDNYLSFAEFNKLSQTLLSTYSHVDSLLYLPNGVVELVYPYEENKRAIGHNVLKDKSRKLGAMESVSGSINTIIGPVTLVQNGKQAFILRKGISDEGEFIGFSSSVIYLESVLKSLDNILKNNHVCNYKVVGYDPDNSNYYDKTVIEKGVVNSQVHKGVITLFNTNWQISISPDDAGLLPRFVVFSTLLLVVLLVASPIKYFNQYRRSEEARYNFQKEAHTDFLTNLLNRRGLESRFESLKKENVSGAVAIFDIDFFKNINDSYGHEVGDIVLVQFSKLCAANMNPQFTLSRTGGEEFVMLMPHFDQHQAQQYCEHLREAVAKAPFFIKHVHINVTVSIGIACFSTADNMENALSDADDALYEAKRTGRNRVCLKG